MTACPLSAISLSWHGENNLAVPTPDHVPNALNRRVMIAIGTVPIT